MLIFDCETGPRPDAELALVSEPFDAASVQVPVGDYPEFDHSTVKLGNTKGPAKVTEKIEAARQLHEAGRAEFEAARANGPALIAAAEAAHWQAIRDKAALSPVTGQVLAIGYLAADKGGKTAIQGVGCKHPKLDRPLTEADLLVEFWGKFLACKQAGRQMVGFNSNSFDLPFLVKRSWLLGIDVPSSLRSPDGRYFDRIFVDLLAWWKCGEWGNNGSIKLAALAKFFGVGDKPDGVTGADFARLWVEEREKAIEYLRNDLVITAGVAARMGFA